MLIWPSAAENDRKMTENWFFVNCFILGRMSTPNEIGSWYSTRTLVLTYLFILWTEIGRGGHSGSPQGGSPPKKLKKKFLFMWHIIRKPMKNSIQIRQSIAYLTPHLTISSWKWPEKNRKIVFYNFLLGEHVHTEWDRKLIFDMDIASDLYFHIMNQNEGGHSGSPRGIITQNIKKKCFRSCKILSKAHEKLYSNISI